MVQFFELKNDKHNIPQLLVSLNHKIQKNLNKNPLTLNNIVLGGLAIKIGLLNRTCKTWHEVRTDCLNLNVLAFSWSRNVLIISNIDGIVISATTTTPE